MESNNNKIKLKYYIFKSVSQNVICTLFTGQPVKRVHITSRTQTKLYRNTSQSVTYVLTIKRVSYKIFVDNKDLQMYLTKNKGKVCETMKSVVSVNEYKEYPNAQVRKLTAEEVEAYMAER